MNAASKLGWNELARVGARASGAAAVLFGLLLGACSGSVEDTSCFSPTQNLNSAYQAGAQGCSCDEAANPGGVCVQAVALMCLGSKWHAVYDGPCSPPVGHAGAGGAGAGGASAGGGVAGLTDYGGRGGGGSTAYTVEACKQAGGIPVPSIGAALDPATDCDSGVALGVIDAASSGWIEGGLCCAVGRDPLPPVGKACGARAGNTCGPDEYCAYVAGDDCGAADAEATCKPRPQAC
ncbi:MAG TPA: hypothetical protein VFK05_25675, partial [Polyangiaceae bacterium]|nr:hypothetical protein [Polyangiaceae bacterium]